MARIYASCWTSTLSKPSKDWGCEASLLCVDVKSGWLKSVKVRVSLSYQIHSHSITEV